MADAWRSIWKPMIYAPALSPGNRIHFIPQPTEQFDIVWAWKRQSHEIPYYSGAKGFGSSEKPATINISGKIGFQDAVNKYTEQSMWAAIEGLRTACNSQSDSNKLELFMWYEADSTPIYRKFKQVWCDNFSPKVGDNDRVAFSFNFTFSTDDPAVYTTAPGS